MDGCGGREGEGEREREREESIAMACVRANQTPFGFAA
jgi:hypothetical protein